MALLSGLDVVKKERATNTANSTLFDKIKLSVNKAIHEHLLKEYSEYYFDGGGTEIAKQDKKGLVKDEDVIKGTNTYRLFIPIEEKVTLTDGNKNKVLASPCRVGKPTMYSEGIRDWVTEYVKINGKTHLWDRKQGKFTLNKTK